MLNLTGFRFLVAIIVLLLALVGPPSAAQAADITVNTTLDVVANDGLCSLREAITATNTDTPSGSAIGECPAGSGDDAITVPAGTYTLTLGSQLVVNTTTTLTGAGAESTIIQAATAPGLATFRVFTVTSKVELARVTIRHGNESGCCGGGGIRNTGTLTLKDSVVTDNMVSAGIGTVGGGGIENWSGAVMTISNTTVRRNSSTVGGGGIRNDGTLAIIESTVNGNTASGAFGGGIDNVFGGTLVLTNSTVSGNSATFGRGGGIDNFGSGSSMSLSQSTIYNNMAEFQGGGIYTNTGTTTLENTILAGNTAALGFDCRASSEFISQGHNLVQSPSDCTITGDTTGNITGQDPRLGPLKDNGGPTFTHALLPGSPAIDAGNPATPGSGGNACEATDQRGVARPKGTQCDIGAYEFDPDNPPSVAGLSQWALIGLAVALTGLVYLRLKRRAGSLPI